jgi:tetratricopeptide (TPR) repeat protein
MILYRPVGLQELALIYDSGMKAFPARLPQQPIFYPVLQLEYARQIALEWNAKNGQLAGYVTQFKVEDDYIGQFEEHTVGRSQHQELWIPAEEMEDFNRHIAGHIKVLEAHFGDTFEGFVPEQFRLQGKSAVEQFTLLANSYLYKRMDFYLEIKRNHKAVFLNFPFWEKHDFKNPGLKEKIIKAIREAWLTSFPKTPLPAPPPLPEESPLAGQTSSRPLLDPVEDETALEEEADLDPWVSPGHTKLQAVQQAPGPASDWILPIHEELAVDGEAATPEDAREHSIDKDSSPVEQRDSDTVADSPHEGQTDPHFIRGVQLGLSGQYREAIDELFKAVQEDPDDSVAHTSLGVAFHRVGEGDRALACYETALKIDPEEAEAHYFRANILYSLGEAQEAIAGYTMAIGLKPDLIRAHEGPAPQDRLTDYSPSPAGMHWIARPAYRILELNRALETDPRQAQWFKERADQYSRLWNYEQAIADYSAALALQPQDASVLHARGVAYEQIGQSGRAQEDYRKAIAIAPQLSNVYLERGVTFGNLGNLRQAIASLTDSIRLAPQNPDAYFNRGTAYFQQGDFESAIEDFSSVIGLSANDDAAYYWRGVSHEQAGRRREAIADYRQFLRISQDPRAREEVEQKLSQWKEGKQNGPTSPHWAGG